MNENRHRQSKRVHLPWAGDVLIPDTWELKKLRFLLAEPVKDGPHETPEFISDGIPFLSVDSIQNGQLTFENCRFISYQDHERFRQKVSPQKGDILLGKAASTGKIAQVHVDFEFGIWSPLALIRLDSTKAIPSYIEYVLKSNYLQLQIDMYCNANTQKNISMQDIPILVCPVPPLPEQRTIVDYLDRETAHIDALIAAKERLLELLAEKRHAIITHTVTRGLNPNAPLRDSGVEWVREIPSHWDVLRLKFLIFGIETGFTPQSNNFPAADGEWGVLKTGCVNGGVFNPQENKALPNSVDIPLELEVAVGDVLMSRASGSTDLIGSVALVDHKPYTRLLLSDKTFRIKVNQQVCDSRFFVSVMGSFFMRRQIKQIVSGAEGLANNIAQTDIREFWLPVPPLYEQREIIKNINEWTTRIDRLHSLAEKTLNLLYERRASLIAAVVSGQINVA